MPGPWDKNLIPSEFDNDTITGNTNGTGFKLEEGAEIRCEVSATGAVSGTSPTLDFKLQDSVDGSSWADTGVAFTQIGVSSGKATNVPQQREFRVKAGRPWVRLVATTGGTSPSFAGVTARLGHWSGRPT
jgi:hypothetical protein